MVHYSHNSGYYRRSVAPWITVLSQHSIHSEGDLQIYSGVIFHETMHHAQAHIISGTFKHCALSLATKRTQMVAQLGG
jgi:hypothetical protein